MCLCAIKNLNNLENEASEPFFLKVKNPVICSCPGLHIEVDAVTWW